LHGSAEQLAAVREDEEFQRNTIDAQLIVDGFHHAEASRTRRSHGRWRSIRRASRAFLRPRDV